MDIMGQLSTMAGHTILKNFRRRVPKSYNYFTHLSIPKNGGINMKIQHFPVDCEDAEIAMLCVLGMVYYDYMPLNAKQIYNSWAHEEKKYILRLRNKGEN